MVNVEGTSSPRAARATAFIPAEDLDTTPGPKETGLILGETVDSGQTVPPETDAEQDEKLTPQPSSYRAPAQTEAISPRPASSETINNGAFGSSSAGSNGTLNIPAQVPMSSPAPVQERKLEKPVAKPVATTSDNKPVEIKPNGSVFRRLSEIVDSAPSRRAQLAEARVEAQQVAENARPDIEIRADISNEIQYISEQQDQGKSLEEITNGELKDYEYKTTEKVVVELAELQKMPPVQLADYLLRLIKERGSVNNITIQVPPGSQFGNVIIETGEIKLTDLLVALKMEPGAFVAYLEIYLEKQTRGAAGTSSLAYGGDGAALLANDAFVPSIGYSGPGAYAATGYDEPQQQPYGDISSMLSMAGMPAFSVNESDASGLGLLDAEIMGSIGLANGTLSSVGSTDLNSFIIQNAFNNNMKLFDSLF